MAITKPDKSIRQQINEKTSERMASAEANPTEAKTITETADALAYVPEAPNKAPLDIPDASDAPEISEPSVAPAPETPAEEPAESEPEAEAPEAKTIAAPVPAAAQSTTEPQQEEWEDAEYEDTSTQHKYRFKAPKGEAEYLRSGWERRADYDRKLGVLGRVKTRLQPMIESGYIEQVLPFFEEIDRDPTLAAAVGQMVQQRRANQPLNYVQPGFEQQFQPQPVAQPAAVAEGTSDEYSDPYLQAAQAPLLQKLSAMDQRTQQLLDMETQRQQALQAEQSHQAFLKEHNAKWTRIHQELARQYPQEFTGDARNQAEMQRLAQLDAYAQQAGYDEQSYGYVGRITYAKQVLDQSAPRRVAAPSAAAQSVAAIEAQSRAKAAEAARNTANAMVVGSQSAPPPAPKRERPIKDKDGKPLPISQATRRVAENVRQRLASAR